MKIAIVQLGGIEYMQKHALLIKSVEEYCKKYGYEHIISEPFIDNISETYQKPFLILDFIDQYDYVAWFDADIYIYNKSIPLEDIILAFERDIYYFDDPGAWKLNAGLLIFKNCEFSKQILNEWKDLSPEGGAGETDLAWREDFEGFGPGDQGSLIKTLYSYGNLDALSNDILNTPLDNFNKNTIALHLMGIDLDFLSVIFNFAILNKSTDIFTLFESLRITLERTFTSTTGVAEKCIKQYKSRILNQKIACEEIGLDESLVDRPLFSNKFIHDAKSFNDEFSICHTGSEFFFKSLAGKSIPVISSNRHEISKTKDIKILKEWGVHYIKEEDFNDDIIYDPAKAEANFNFFKSNFTIPHAGHWKTKLSKVFICGEQMIHEGWSLPEKDFSPFRGLGKVNLLTFFESHFGWMQTNHKNMMQEFYDAFPKEDFIAIIHDPFDSYKYINKIQPYPDLVLDIIKKFCKGLFFLSQHESNKFQLFFNSIGINVPCESIYHPVKNTGVKFDFDCFYKMPNKQIISSGMHLRNASGILSQPLPDNYTMACTPWNQETEFYFTSAGHKGLKSINKLSQSKTLEYYKLYKDNIFYLNTLACVANNVLLDCIDSGCPILVNRNPSSEEYLGKNYPLFFDSLDQAYNILLEDSSIEVGHLYLTKLKAIRRERSLKDQILASKIYKSL